MIRLSWIIIFLMPLMAQARVFNVNSERFAAYFNVTGGGSTLGTSALDAESGKTVVFSGGTSYNYTGEFGFLISSAYLGLRLGFEIIKPFALDSTAQSGSSSLYSVTSTMVGYAPKVSLDLNLHSGKTSRSFISLSVATASLNLKNEYTLTTAGQTAYPGVTDHTAESKGENTMLAASAGYEGLLTDTTTIIVEFGYRQLSIDSLNYTKDVTTFDGAVVSGGSVLDSYGNKRDLNLSGGFLSIGFRFYM